MLIILFLQIISFLEKLNLNYLFSFILFSHMFHDDWINEKQLSAPILLPCLHKQFDIVSERLRNRRNSRVSWEICMSSHAWWLSGWSPVKTATVTQKRIEPLSPPRLSTFHTWRLCRQELSFRKWAS